MCHLQKLEETQTEILDNVYFLEKEKGMLTRAFIYMMIDMCPRRMPDVHFRCE